MSMLRHSLQQHAKRVLSHRSTTRLFCSNTNRTLRASSVTLQDRIELAINQKAGITTVLEQWRQQQGYQLNPSLVKGLFMKLCAKQQLYEALEVSNWMVENKICNLTSEDFTSQFHLIEKLLGFEEAEKFFESIPENQRSESIYDSLLKIYARRSGKDVLVKAESSFKKMKELGLVVKSSPYNSMISLYSSVGNRDMVDEILREMKESIIEFDSFTVNKALQVYADASDVTTMDKFLSEWGGTAKLEWRTTLDMAKAYLRDGCMLKARRMVGRTEELKDPESYEELLRLYGEIGKREDVYRVWDLYKVSGKLNNEGFGTLIGSLLKLNDLKGAEEIYFKEWKCSGLKFEARIPNMLVSVYNKKGMKEKADKLLNETLRNTRLVSSPILALLKEWKKEDEVRPRYVRNFIKDLCDSNHLSKALEVSSLMCEKKLFDIFPQDYATRLHLIENVLGLEEAEKFFESGIPENMKDYSVYSTLLTLYTRSVNSIEKAEATFEKMRELGFLSKVSPFNSMISLYTELRKPSKVEILLREMKEKNIEPDTVTLNNLLKVFADKADINTMEKYKREWDGYEKKNKLEVSTMDAMAKAYEKSGSTLKAIEMSGSSTEVHRLWNEYKNNKKEPTKNEGYLSVVRSLLRLDDVQGAEKIYGEWKPYDNKFETRIGSLLISRYCEEEEYDEAKTMKVVKSVRNKRRLLHYKIFLEGCAGAMIVSIVVGFVPGMIWFCGGEPLIVWGSLGIILYYIALGISYLIF